MQLDPHYGADPIITLDGDPLAIVAPAIRQRERLAATVAEFTDERWAHPSRCAGWSNRSARCCTTPSGTPGCTNATSWCLDIDRHVHVIDGPGAADFTLSGETIEVLEALSVRRRLDQPVPSDLAWMLDGLATIFDNQ